MVFFWLSDEVTAAGDARRQLLEDCHAYLAKVPGVRHRWAGRPAMTPRDVVDNTYDVGLCILLDDDAAHDVYQGHALHKQFIERNKPGWRRVQIYDFRSET